MPFKKLLYLVSGYPRWSETFVRQDIVYLQRQGIDLRLVSLYVGDVPCREDWPQPEYLCQSDGRRQGSSSWKKLGDVLPGSLREQLSLYRHRRFVKSLVERCAALGIGHIFGEFGDLAGLLASRVASLLGCEYSLGLHACDVHRFKYSSRMFANARSILICNKSARSAFLQRFPQFESKVFLIHHGLELNAWQFAQREMGHRLIFVGRLVPKKGVDVLLEAVRLLVADGVEVTLDIVGEGPLETPLRQQAGELPVRWLGRKEREEVRALLEEGGCLVMPSRVDANGDRDGVPNVVLEAMAVGVPVVGSQAGGLPEVLTPATGWPVEELTPAALAHALMELWSSPQARADRCLAARELVEKEYDAERLAEERAAAIFR